MSRNYKFHNPDGIYFISFATIKWIDLFVRERYFVVLANSLEYCQKNKGMIIYAWCIMTNHVHLIFRAESSNPSDLIRDMKTYTSKTLQKTINDIPGESRKEWLLQMMKEAGAANCNVKQYQLWQQHNQPIELFTNHMIDQKVDYIHNNPVVAGFVENPTDWKYSSAKNYAGECGVIDVCLV